MLTPDSYLIVFMGILVSDILYQTGLLTKLYQRLTRLEDKVNDIENTVFSNASGLALSGQVYKLNPSDSITITYTGAPTWEWLSD